MKVIIRFAQSCVFYEVYNMSTEHSDHLILNVMSLVQIRNGWWRFESRNNEDLEEAFRGGEQQVNLSLSAIM